MSVSVFSMSYVEYVKIRMKRKSAEFHRNHCVTSLKQRRRDSLKSNEFGHPYNSALTVFPCVGSSQTEAVSEERTTGTLSRNNDHVGTLNL
jgi:hypothetical protein